MDTVKSDQPMPDGNKCPQCGTPLGSGAVAGLCPACLLKAGAAADTITDAKQPPFNPPGIAELAPLFPQLEILELIGKGGMGAVYKARQKQLDRIVALKILPPGIGDDPAFAERFTREAKALAKLNHPGIVTLYEFGVAAGGTPDATPLYFFLMEFVDGVNLRQLLHAGRISPREALAIVPQICDALQFAHDQGIVHRDIKPENILLDRRGRVKVADFGLAKIVGTETSFGVPPSGGSGAANPDRLKAELQTSLTDAGKTMGTPNYMAPEQKEHPDAVDHRADIYALGVVFYQMLTGELPGKQLQPPSSKVQIDVRLDEIILRALEKNPELRYQQVSEVKTMVETIASSPKKSEVRSQKPKGAPGHFFPPGTPLPTASFDDSFRTTNWWWPVLGIPGIFLVFYILKGGRLVDYLGSDSFELSLALMGAFALLTLLSHVRKNRGRIVLVGVSSGKREINWTGVIQMWVVVYAAFLAGSYIAFGHWVPLHDLIAGMVGAATLVTAALVQVELKKPLEQLSPGSSRHDEAQMESERRKAESGKPSESLVTSATTNEAPRFSRMAIAGACWMPLFFIAFLMLLVKSVPSGEYHGPEWWQYLLMFTLLPLGITAPFGATILGWIAVTQIRRSAAKLHGLWLAVFDGLFFPLLVVDGAIAWLWLVLAKLFARQVLGLQNSLFLDLWDLTIWVSLALASAALVDWLIIRRVWRAVKKGGAGAPPAESASKNSTGKIAAIGFGVLVLGAGIAVLSVHQSSNNKLREAALTSADFHYRVFEADAALVDRLIPVAQRQPGVQPTAKFLARYNPGETSKTVGSGSNSFTVTKRGSQDTDPQVAVIDLDTLHELLEGIAKKSGVLVDQTQTVSGIWWPGGTATGWSYSTQKDGLAISGSGGIQLAYTVDDVRDKIRIEGQVSHNSNFVADADGITAKVLYEGDTPLAHALAFLVPYLWKDNSAHYLVVVYEVSPRGNAPIQTAKQPVKQPLPVLSFGPVVERLVADSSARYASEGERTNALFMIDFDSGRLFAGSSELWAAGKETELAWMQTNGVDAMGFIHTFNGLAGVDMKLVAVSASMWVEGVNTSTRDQLTHSEPQETAVMDTEKNPSKTWLFKTREGGLGILQITGFTENPRGVKIRYKLVQNDGSTGNATSSSFREYSVNLTFAELARKYPVDAPEFAATRLAMELIGNDPTAAVNRYAMDIPRLPEGAVTITMSDADRAWSRRNKPLKVMIYRDELAAVILPQQTNNLLQTAIWGRRHGQWKICLKADLPGARTLAEAENNFRERAAELYDNFQQLPDQQPSLVEDATRELTTNLTQMAEAMVNSVTQMMSQVPGMQIGTPITQRSMTVTVVTNTPNATSNNSSTRDDAALLSATNPLPSLASEEGVYVIASGDTVVRIARRFGISVADLMAMNPELVATRLKIGQKIRVSRQTVEDLKARLEAASSINSFTEQDKALAAIARDAATAGEAALAKLALAKMTAFTARDQAALEAARELVKAGRRAEAIEIAKTITSFTQRDAALKELAQ
jgi:serine/threonine protein kinase/LysM repeat protein